jgi:hypothetical protein
MKPSVTIRPPALPSTRPVPKIRKSSATSRIIPAHDGSDLAVQFGDFAVDLESRQLGRGAGAVAVGPKALEPASTKTEAGR